MSAVAIVTLQARPRIQWYQEDCVIRGIRSCFMPEEDVENCRRGRGEIEGGRGGCGEIKVENSQ